MKHFIYVHRKFCPLPTRHPPLSTRFGSRRLPQRKIAPNPKTNPKPNPNPNRGATFLGGNCLVAPNPKTNPDLDTNPNPNQGAIRFVVI